MSQKLDQKIYKLLLDHCGGKREQIKGSNVTTLSLMANGKSNLTVASVKKLLADNGMTGEITIFGAGTKTTINFFE